MIVIAAFAGVAAAILFASRRIGSVLAFLAGGTAFLLGAVLAALSGFGGQGATPQVVATIYLGAGIAIFAVIDLILLALGRSGPAAT